jgi:hypothetical protein
VKDPIVVLRTKEREILKIKVEIEALRIAAQLLSDDVLPTEATQTQAAPPLDFDALEAALDALDGYPDPLRPRLA